MFGRVDREGGRYVLSWTSRDRHGKRHGQTLADHEYKTRRDTLPLVKDEDLERFGHPGSAMEFVCVARHCRALLPVLPDTPEFRRALANNQQVIPIAVAPGR